LRRRKGKANQNAVTQREGGVKTRVSASLAVFRIGHDGKLTFVRKYDIETGQGRSLMWAGLLSLD
jgi:6-phosphogluconolactonase